MPYCVVKSCKNNNIGKVNTGLSFHKFPRDPYLREKWTQIIRKTKTNNNWTPSDYCVICSAHFEDDDLYSAKTGLRRLRNDAIPTKNIFLDSATNPVHNSLDLLSPTKTKSTLRTTKQKKNANVSIKMEHDSSDSDDPLLSTEQNSPPQLISEVSTNTQTNRRLVIYFDASVKTKKDSVESVTPKSPTRSQVASTSTQHNFSIIEHDPLSIKEEIKIELDDEDPIDNVIPTPSQSNISIISVQHQPDYSKKKDAECKKKDTDNKKKKSELSAVQNNSNLFGDTEKDYVRVCPNIYRLEKDVTRLQTLRIKYKRKLKTLQQQIRRLKNRNASLKAKIKSITGSTSTQMKESSPSERPIPDDNTSMSS